MMMARPRTGGAAARRKQRALAATRARSESRSDVSRPQSRAQSARPRSAAAVYANGTATPGRPASRNSISSASGVRPPEEPSAAAAIAKSSTTPGPSMTIPKVLFVIFFVGFVIGIIMVALTSLSPRELGSTKLVGIFIMAGSSVFLIAAFIVCLCKRAHWAADHADDDVTPNAASARSRRSRYAANHVEDESSRPPSRAWNIDESGGKGRPASAMSTKSASDIEMTLTSDRQKDLFSSRGNGNANGGFSDAEDKLAFRTTPQIKITCEDDDDNAEDKTENIESNITIAADVENMQNVPPEEVKLEVESSNFEDIKLTLADENLSKAPKLEKVPSLDLSNVFPSPSIHRKSFDSEAYSLDHDRDHDSPRLDNSAPSTASYGSNSPHRTQLNDSTTSSMWNDIVQREQAPKVNAADDIEVKVIKAVVTDNLELTQPETIFKLNAKVSNDAIEKNNEAGVTENESKSSLEKTDSADAVPFNLGLLVTEGRPN